jgi:hypothetical protein
VYQHFRFVELKVLFIRSNKELIDSIIMDYKGKRFNSVVLAPGHGADNDATIYQIRTLISLHTSMHINHKACQHINLLSRLKR